VNLHHVLSFPHLSFSYPQDDQHLCKMSSSFSVLTASYRAQIKDSVIPSSLFSMLLF
jgi:hypothetical protein